MHVSGLINPLATANDGAHNHSTMLRDWFILNFTLIWPGPGQVCFAFTYPKQSASEHREDRLSIALRHALTTATYCLIGKNTRSKPKPLASKRVQQLWSTWFGQKHTKLVGLAIARKVWRTAASTSASQAANATLKAYYKHNVHEAHNASFSWKNCAKVLPRNVGV